MAGTFINTLTSAEEVANITKEKITSFEVHTPSGRCTIRWHKLDSSDNIISKHSQEFTLSGTDLSTPTTTIGDAAKTAGVLQAGTIAET